MEMSHKIKLLPYIVVIDENDQIVSKVTSLNTSTKKYSTKEGHSGVYKNLYILESAFNNLSSNALLILYQTKEIHNIEVVHTLPQKSISI